MGSHAMHVVLDPVWDVDSRVGYHAITPHVDMKKGRSKGPREWASERLARAVFGNRAPEDAKTAKAIWSRLNDLCAEIAPGYDGKLFGGCHLGNDLLSKHAGNVDVCVIAALRRYCMLAPEDVYPCEIRSWPWNAEEVQHWVAEQKRKMYRLV